MKRIEELHHLSHDHHHGLLVCWKIRTAFSKGIEMERVKNYLKWFYEYHLKTHFEIEEQTLLPVVGTENEYGKQMLAEHQQLRDLFETTEISSGNLTQIEELLQAHIRFEERQLFPIIQDIATTEQLKVIAAADNEEKFVDNESDAFWV
ncbi:MAG TPA: hemerythrin domain-containing protein [Flavobacterium sp.]|nr:hemerythrin domain-containing protein [Flavobacterium sp.]